MDNCSVLFTTTLSPPGLSALQGGNNRPPWKAQSWAPQVDMVKPAFQTEPVSPCCSRYLPRISPVDTWSYMLLVLFLSRAWWSAGVSALCFCLTLNGRRVSESDSDTEIELLSGQVIHMSGRLHGGASQAPHRLPNGALQTEWFCAACNHGGCWPTKPRCFRCKLSRVESEGMLGAFPTLGVGSPKGGKGQGGPQRENHFPGRAPMPRSQFTTGRPAKKAKQVPPPSLNVIDMIGLLKGLGCSEEVIAEVQENWRPLIRRLLLLEKRQTIEQKQ